MQERAKVIGFFERLAEKPKTKSASEESFIHGYSDADAVTIKIEEIDDDGKVVGNRL